MIYSTGVVYAAQGKKAEALAIIKDLEKISGNDLRQAHWIAKIYSVMGDKDQAFVWLERGLAAGSIGAFYRDESAWDNLRSDPRFPDLLKRMGVPPR